MARAQARQPSKAPQACKNRPKKNRPKTVTSETTRNDINDTGEDKPRPVLLCQRMRLAFAAALGSPLIFSFTSSVGLYCQSCPRTWLLPHRNCPSLLKIRSSPPVRT